MAIRTPRGIVGNEPMNLTDSVPWSENFEVFAVIWDFVKWDNDMSLGVDSRRSAIR
jgi:hypothetical protein